MTYWGGDDWQTAAEREKQRARAAKDAADRLSRTRSYGGGGGGGGSRPPNKTCVCMVMVSLGALAEVAYHALRPYLSFKGFV